MNPFPNLRTAYLYIYVCSNRPYNLTNIIIASNNANFWKVLSVSKDDYQRLYKAIRLNYTEDSFLNFIYTYYLSKGLSLTFNIVYNVGCSSGAAAKEFASCFDHVVASDINASSFDSACCFLAVTSIPEAKLSFFQYIGEALAKHYLLQSADLIRVAECITFIDKMLALKAFATVLKLSSILAIWFYSCFCFLESDTCQSLFDQIIDCTLYKVINKSRQKRIASQKRANSGNRSWLDYLDFSTGLQKHVQRMKQNSKSADLGQFI